MASEKVGDGEGGGGSIIKIFRSTEIVIIYAISNDYLLLKSGEAEEDCCEENWMVGGKLAHLCDYLWNSTLDFDYLTIN